jgi:hypothetical protein
MLVKDYIKKHGNAHFQNVLTKQGKEKLSHPNWIITDMRFPNELEAVVKRNGITIRVVRPHGYTDPNTGVYKEMPLSYHLSETSLDDAEFDYTILNDGSLEDLVKKVREILITEKII